MKPSNISSYPTGRAAEIRDINKTEKMEEKKASKVPRRSGYSRGNRFNGLASTTGRCFRARRLGKGDGEREKVRKRKETSS